MSHKSYRIKTNVGGDDNVISVNLKQGVKTLNILSLEINPEDAYDVQTSDYGVIVGRVLANNAFGVPNVKVSVFIPISPEDENDYVVSNEYPYKTPQSKDINGVKYNLIHHGKNSPGTFPTKNMVLDNDGTLEVYDRYFKYTTVTNESGDYMIFGVPTGTTQVHYDCDLSDIGILSQHPYDLISKGYDANLFESKTEFTNKDLASAVHIISQDSTVFVYPFWGDKNANKIGITRKDIDINYEFTPSCVFMGSSITDAVGSYIGVDGQPSENSGRFESLSTSVGDIEMIRYTQDGKIEEVKDNVVGIIDGNGVWCYQIPMNLDRIGTDEEGNIVAISDPTRGIPTRARVRFRISLTDTSDPSTSSYTAKFLVPCNPKLVYSTNPSTNKPYIDDDLWFDWENNFYEFGQNTPDCCFRDLYWGKVYSVKQYYPRFQYEYWPKELWYYDSQDKMLSTNHPYYDGTFVPITYGDGKTQSEDLFDFRGYPSRFSFFSSCISSIDIVNGLNTFPYTTMYAGAEDHLDFRASYWFYYHISNYSTDYNMTSRGLHFCFENDWVNGCLYFPRVIIKRDVSGDYDYFGKNNDNGGFYSRLYLSGRHHWFYDYGEGAFRVMFPSAIFYGTGYYEKPEYIELYGRQWLVGYKPDIKYDGSTVWQNTISSFSRVVMNNGILTKKETMLGDSVFYYICGFRDSYGRDYSFKRFYTTDIILLGNLEDIYDSLPKLYNNLPATTAIFPPISTPRSLSESGMSKHGYADQILIASEHNDTELTDIFRCGWDADSGGYNLYPNKNGNKDYLFGDDYKSYPNAEALYNRTNEGIYRLNHGNVDAVNLLSGLLRRSSLFFGLKIRDVDDFLEYDVPTFVNTSRICELDVHNDSACLVPGTNIIIPTNGLIDRFDISTNENRSSFASMNYDIEKYVINPNTGYKQYVTTPLYITGFEGRLEPFINNTGFEGLSEYNIRGTAKFADDAIDYSYVSFRFGRNDSSWRGPFTQEHVDFYPNVNHSDTPGVKWNEYDYCNRDLILPKDSFYFYFGLRTGFSAIDVLRDKFVGDSKNTETDITGIKCYVDQSKVKCNDGVETGSVKISFINMSDPIEYQIYYKNLPYSKNILYGNEVTLDNLLYGVYKVVAIDSNNREYSSYFSILGSTIILNADAYRKDGDERGYLKFISDSSSTVESVVAEGDEHESVKITTADNTQYLVTFSEKYETIISIENEIVFSGITDSVNASVKIVGRECVETNMTYVFVGNEEPVIVLNGVPVENINKWKAFNVNDRVEYDEGEPDEAFSGTSYYVWDGINTAHPHVSGRTYDFSSTDGNYLTKLSCISSMCSRVFGDYQMFLANRSTNNNYEPVAISPYYTNNIHFSYPYLYWNSNEDMEGKLMDRSLSGQVQINRDVPHIVGSNYPVSASTMTYLKISANEYSNGEIDKYINNRTIRKEGCGVGVDEIFGINLFGVNHKYNSDLDLPGKLEIQPDISVSADTYNISGATNFFGVRTVDKRFDYQFTLKTPLLLPSGYDLFENNEGVSNLAHKTFVNGKICFDLYGGFRLNHDEVTGEIQCYSSTTESIGYGPDSGATLYSTSIYQDNVSTTQVRLHEHNHNIWYSNGKKDIDHVTFSGETENYINGINNITLAFTDCFTGFGDGYAGPGNTEQIGISYESGINIVRNGDTDYDVMYKFQPQFSNNDSASGSCNASLSGSTLTFMLAKDEVWGGSTYTDAYMNGNHDSGVYPRWASRYQSDFPYDVKSNELAIYSCEPSSTDVFSVTSGFTVNLEVLPNELSGTPQYNGSKYISVFYKLDDTDVDIPMNDEECSGTVQFVIGNQNAVLGEDSFLIIPTRKVYTMEEYGTSLKQGVVYNMGYVYYTGSIFIEIDRQNRNGIIRLNTPLRKYDGTIDYASQSLIGTDFILHTIGNVNNYYCSSADVTYDSSRCEFTLTNIDMGGDVDVYFEMENGLRYKVVIEL